MDVSRNKNFNKNRTLFAGRTPSSQVFHLLCRDDEEQLSDSDCTLVNGTARVDNNDTVTRNMDRMNVQHGPRCSRNLFGPDKNAAVDDEGSEIPYQVRGRVPRMSADKKPSSKLGQAGAVRSDRDIANTDSFLIDSSCASDLDITRQMCQRPPTDTECATSGAASNLYLLPQSRLLALPIQEPNSYLSPVHGVANLRRLRELESDTDDIVSTVKSRRPHLHPYTRSRLAFIRRRRLSIKACDEESSSENVASQHANHVPLSAGNSTRCVLSPDRDEHVTSRQTRRQLFENDSSSHDKYFYVLHPPCNAGDATSADVVNFESMFNSPSCVSHNQSSAYNRSPSSD